MLIGLRDGLVRQRTQLCNALRGYGAEFGLVASKGLEKIEALLEGVFGRAFRTNVQPGARISRSVLLGADFYESDEHATTRGGQPRLGIGRDVVLDRVIVDKNARIGDGAHLVNEASVQRADGDGYYIRDGVIIVPKDGVIRPGTRV